MLRKNNNLICGIIKDLMLMDSTPKFINGGKDNYIIIDENNKKCYLFDCIPTIESNYKIDWYDTKYEFWKFNIESVNDFILTKVYPFSNIADSTITIHNVSNLKRCDEEDISFLKEVIFEPYNEQYKKFIEMIEKAQIIIKDNKDKVLRCYEELEEILESNLLTEITEFYSDDTPKHIYSLNLEKLQFSSNNDILTYLLYCYYNEHNNYRIKSLYGVPIDISIN